MLPTMAFCASESDSVGSVYRERELLCGIIIVSELEGRLESRLLGLLGLEVGFPSPAAAVEPLSTLSMGLLVAVEDGIEQGWWMASTPPVTRLSSGVTVFVWGDDASSVQLPFRLRLGLGLGLGFGSILTKRGEANSIDESLGHVIALEDAIVVEEDSCFKQATRNTTPRGCLRSALEIRRLQRETRLGRCDVRNAKKELIERPVWPPPAVSSHSSGNNSSSSSSSVKSIRKEELEQVLRRLLPFLKPDAFQCAVKAINGHILGVLEGGAYSSGRVDIGLFLALIAPICSGPRDKRKMVVFDALAWRRSSSSKDLPKDVVPKSDVSLYLRWLRAIYFPVTTRVDGKLKIYPHPQQASTVSFPDFVSMFDDPNSGFGILDLVSKLENSDNVRHYGQTCVVCSYPITGNWFKEVSLNFNLCCLCYSEGKVPRFASKRTEYYFKELSSEAEGMKEKLCLFRSRSLAHKTK